jgi:uncharacterized membrane protein
MKTDDATRSKVSPWLAPALWAVAAVLVIIGVAAAIGRVVFADDVMTRADPVRQWLMDALHREDPFAAQRPAELALVDGKFATNRFLTLWHVLPGGIFLLFAPLQFSTWIRRRSIRFHRWSGRLLLPAVVASVLPGMYFGILIPYGGPSEAVVIAASGGLLVIAVCRGFLAIRRRQVARHREWMIRVFALAIAISTVRVVAVPLDVALTPAGFRPQTLFAISVWTGWIITLGVAELWIRYTRARRDVVAVPIAV